MRERLPPLSAIIPWRAWSRDRDLRSWNTVVFVALVCAPTAIFVATENHGTLKSLSWAFALFFAAAWLLILRTVIRPVTVHLRSLVAVVVVALLTEFPLAVWLEKALHAQTSSVALSVLTVGLPEELAKMLPVAVLAWVFRRQWASFSPRDYMFLGAASGLAFGAGEAVGYVYQATNQAAQGVISAPTFVLEVVWRLVDDPMIHGVWAAISCYFLGLAIRHLRYRYGLAGFGLAMSAVLHGINDHVAGHVSWIAVRVVSVVLLLAYAHSGDRVETAVSAAEKSATRNDAASGAPIGAAPPYSGGIYPPPAGYPAPGEPPPVRR